jgi:hypothetical protein
MEVPLIVLVAVSLVDHADVMASPGAAISTQLPKLLNEARASVMVLADTVMAAAALEGEKLQASTALLPAATTTVTPAFTRF